MPDGSFESSLEPMSFADSKDMKGVVSNGIAERHVLSVDDGGLTQPEVEYRLYRRRWCGIIALVRACMRCLFERV